MYLTNMYSLLVWLPRHCKDILMKEKLIPNYCNKLYLYHGIHVYYVCILIVQYDRIETFQQLIAKRHKSIPFC